MKRVIETPRIDYKSKVENDGLNFHDLEGLQWAWNEKPDNYWTEEGSVEITMEAEKQLIEATYVLHSMCLELVERVVNDDVLLTLFEIPRVLWPAIKKSWGLKKPDLMGRFDLAWDGTGPPKMLEYNGDTPSVLVESGLSQLNWQKEVHPEDF
jgi:glutathionylspermidine synthase